MAKFVLSAFADEVSPQLDEQLAYLNRMDIGALEPRNVDGTNVSSLSLEQAKAAKKKMDSYGIRVSSIGSPIGKIKVTDAFDDHLRLFENTMDIAEIFETKNIRIFSFYFPEGADPKDYRDEVLRRLETLLTAAEKRGLVLCHENERAIYGETPENCYDLMQYFGGRMKSVFDNGNFTFCFTQAYPKGLDLLKPYIEYLHIKDADKDGTIVPAGKGAGKIKETLMALKDMNQTYFLTIEPHLKVFSGLDKLSNLEELKVQNAYRTSEEAFTAAVDAIRGILADIA